MLIYLIYLLPFFDEDIPFLKLKLNTFSSSLDKFELLSKDILSANDIFFFTKGFLVFVVFIVLYVLILFISLLLLLFLYMKLLKSCRRFDKYNIISLNLDFFHLIISSSNILISLIFTKENKKLKV